MGTQLVWFKRDLRTHDNAALSAAAALGPVMCVYIVEPSYWRCPDASQRQLDFLHECLRDLYRQLKACGVQLQVVTGEVPDVLERLHQSQSFSHLHSHQETGNGMTYLRDKAVARWCAARCVQWQEHWQNGVVRKLPSRDLWSDIWTQRMQQAQLGVPSLTPAPWPWPVQSWPDGASWSLPQDAVPQRQTGGRALALQTLHSFLQDRSRQYRGGISSPLSAASACSRLSPYLSWGCLSLREVVQATESVVRQPGLDSWTRKGLVAFISRLHWHCHFMQKLESEPAIEHRNMHRGYDGLRENDWNPEHFERLRTARTGWPLVDACVTMLQQTGWLNFRMRAMLVSVAAYPLWLHWKEVGHWLAGQFVDYEPGIHWSQMQMQSGTTGINTTRVYNPIKQAQDHDPQGLFVRRWLPVLRRVPDSWLFEPWKMPPSVQQQCCVIVGTDWPEPPVDLPEATRQAKALLHARRQTPQVREGKQAVIEQHASRRGQAFSQRRRRAAPTDKLQTGWDF
jgi:deoxyribodipyrimidine photo-lyase